jgi:hypothetical protein
MRRQLVDDRAADSRADRPFMGIHATTDMFAGVATVAAGPS